MRAGFTLAAQGFLGDPFLVPTGRTAHVAPAYPLLIATCVRVFGENALGFDVARSLVVLGFGAFLASLPFASQRLGLGKGAGLLAATVFLPPGIPVFAWTEASGQHEALLTLLTLYALWVSTAVAFEDGPPPPARAGLLGLAWGVGAHVSPLLAVVLGAMLMVIVAMAPRRSRRGYWLPVFVLVSLFAISLVPWTVRNYGLVGKITLVRDNFGLELAVSNADNATADMRENMLPGKTMATHPFLDSAEARRMAALGERAYYERRGAEGRAWIVGHPTEFSRLTAHRIHLFFFPRLGMEHHATFYLFAMVAGLVGLVRLASRRRYVAGLFVMAFVAYALPYFLIQGHARYSYPILWIPTLLACWVASEFFSVARRRFRPQTITTA